MRSAIQIGNVPTLEEAWEFVRKGKIPAATHTNLQYVKPHLRYQNGLHQEISLMLADPQTAGGLLIAVSSEKTEQLITRLQELKTPAASHIGLQMHIFSVHFDSLR